MRRLITVRLRLEFVLCSLVTVPLAMAQDEASVVPVAIPDVAARAEELDANLRRVEALLAPSYEIQAIEAAVDDASDVLMKLRGELDAVNDDEISMECSMIIAWVGATSTKN